MSDEIEEKPKAKEKAPPPRKPIDRTRITKLAKETLWAPQPGPQLAALLSKADVLLYGGAAGGGKTNLAIGLALTSHRRTLFVRKEATQLLSVVDEISNIVGNRDGFNGSTNVWRMANNRVIQFGGVPNPGDETKFMGNPRDLLACDEAANLFEDQVRFLMGWVRSTDPKQRCRTLLCSNPPTSADGEWLIRWFAPWLDKSHPRPARPGELRFVTTIKGKDVWLDGPQAIVVENDKGVKERVIPLSRTFIPAKVTDNRYLRGTGYVSTLQAMPEPLRSIMLYGDFAAGREDAPYQVIPTEWVRAAQERWKARPKPTTPMTAIGVDVARGGKDSTVLSPRYDNWFGPQIVKPGKYTPDGQSVAQLVLQNRKDRASVNVDVIGCGAGATDVLKPILGHSFCPMDGRHASRARDRSRQLGFANKRAEWWWKMREALDPASKQDLALPPDPALLADLCAPLWKLVAKGVQVESKEDIQKRIGRSPDRGDAIVYALAPPERGPSWEGIEENEPFMPRRM